MTVQVAFQGEPGAYSEMALNGYFNRRATAVPCPSFEAVFQTVKDGVTPYGIIPIENSLAGSIHRNYDLLMQYPLWVVGEYHMPVHHCLVGFAGQTITEIRKVVSHPQALAQCDVYLRTLGAIVEPVNDTAGAVRMLRDSGDRNMAVVASRRAAELYGMSILAEDIEDNPANFTRFLLIHKEPVSPHTRAKTSIVFSLENRAGSLFRALSVFALRDIDLTKIESRPLVGKPWDYLFYVDFLGAAADKHVAHALENLTEYTSMLRVLGSYPRHHG